MAFEGDLADGVAGEFGGKVKAMESLQEEEGANAVVEVVGLAAELIEFVGFGEELFQSERFAGGGESGVAGSGIRTGDEVGKHGRESVSGRDSGASEGTRVPLSEEFDDGGHDFVPVWPGEGECELGSEKAIAFSEIEALSVDAEGKIFAAVGEVLEGGGKPKSFSIGKLGELLLEVGDGLGGKDVHPEEAEVVAGPETGDDEFLFGEGGSGLFADAGDFVDGLAAGLQVGGDGAIEVKLGFVGGLHTGDGGVLGSGESDDLLNAGFFTEGAEEVVTYEEEERAVVDELVSKRNGVSVAKGLFLLDKGETLGMGAGGELIAAGFARRDDDGDGIDASGKDFGEENLKCGAGLSLGVDKGLERKVFVSGIGGSDDCFGDVHERAFNVQGDSFLGGK